MNQVVIGLAGHIDHGKTSLVQALTGTDTDRLEEEIRRGMTIDLGFAFLNDEITLIDVPGHEKFVKNMMAGASGIDAGLLVIAADDGVMPQTREHLEILNLMGIEKGIVALNKIDLADKDWLELVKLDILELMSTSSFPDAEIMPVSALHNIGIEALRKALLNLSKESPQRNDRCVFRMPVDRVFTKHGFGTVITGTVESGQVKHGDEIELLPIEKRVKVRGLQSHGMQVKKVSIGDRAAINLQNIAKSDIDRGYQLTSPGYFKPTKEFGAKLSLLKTAKDNLKQNQRVRIHLGTEEVMGRIAVLSSNGLCSGETAPVIIKLETPLVAAMGDKFITRRYSPVTTIGGGTILDAHLNGSWKQKKQYLLSIDSDSHSSSLICIISAQGLNPLDKTSIGLKFGKSEELLFQEIESMDEIQLLENKADKWLVTKSQLRNCKEKVQTVLQEFQNSHPYKGGALLEEIYQKMGGNLVYIEYVLEVLSRENVIGHSGEFWHTYGYKIELDYEQEQIYNLLLGKLEQERFTSSSIKDLSHFVKQSGEITKNLLDVGETRGELIRLTGSLLFTQNNFNLLRNHVIKFLEQKGSMTVAEFKDLAGTTRKYAVPLLEYFDKNRITFRDGNTRKLAS